MNGQAVDFNRGVIRPTECISEGWKLIKNDYWLFLGISLVGILIGSVGPFGILMGPMMCGVHMCLLARMRNEQVSFNLLFKGFDYFVPSLVATLLQMLPVVVAVVLSYVVFLVFFVLAAGAGAAAGGEAAVVLMVVGVVVFVVALMLLMVAITLPFVFVYPLIVERKLDGIAATKASAKAVMGNLGGVAGLLFLNFLMGLVGVMACYVGAIFLMPIGFAATAVAYRQVFPAQFAPPQHYAPPPQHPDYGQYYQGPQ